MDERGIYFRLLALVREYICKQGRSMAIYYSNVSAYCHALYKGTILSKIVNPLRGSEKEERREVR